MAGVETFLVRQQIERIHEILSRIKNKYEIEESDPVNISHNEDEDHTQNNSSSDSSRDKSRYNISTSIEDLEQLFMGIDSQLNRIHDQEHTYQKQIGTLNQTISQQRLAIKKFDADWASEMDYLSKSWDSSSPASDLDGILLSYCHTQRLPKSFMRSLNDPRKEKGNWHLNSVWLS
eukprot:TRINITY_DN3590_c0_g1_i2.p1 TRINITY_DN3590_c0_g1~~TRINITY_DN3590_c0_g1_i2.p1  ORF type:complete len:176 (-),score=24.62 TRINITY_DN3590_c0_g1_i2:543-1070(-)